MAAAGLLVAALAAPWEVPPPPADPLGQIERYAAIAALDADGPAALADRGCDRGSPDEAIVVCGRGARFERMAMPPVPGARRRLIAGEPPSAAAALGSSCIGLCGGGVGIAVNPVALLRDPIAELRRALHIER